MATLRRENMTGSASLEAGPFFRHVGTPVLCNTEEVLMKCEHCDHDMVEEPLRVVGGVVRVKGVSAWHCPRCGWLEYGYSTSRQQLLPVHARAS
jgi:hypothetical protein